MDNLLPFDQRLQLFVNDLMFLAEQYGINPPEKIYHQFGYEAKDHKIWYIINEPAIENLVIEGVKLYRLHFPEGQGRMHLKSP